MLIEIHMIQNHSPANLNRDDLGAPKTCWFGGVLRSRISSQCLKRSIRMSKPFKLLCGGKRTRRLPYLIAKEVDDRDVLPIATEIIQMCGIQASDDDDKDDVIVFLSKTAVTKMAELLKEQPDSITKTKKEELARQFAELIAKERHMPDMALSGRMLAPAGGAKDVWKGIDPKIDAALQTAHAISTHAALPEIDYFVAADDVPAQEAGQTHAGGAHIGEAQFASACFYKYFAIDWDQLVENLKEFAGDHEKLAAHTVGAFLQAAAEVNPTGKQNSFAAHNHPDGVLVEIKDAKTPTSYANAFAIPVSQENAFTAKGGEEPRGFIGQSIVQLAQYVRDMEVGYGMPRQRFWFSPNLRVPLAYVERKEEKYTDAQGQEKKKRTDFECELQAASYRSLEELVPAVIGALGFDWEDVRQVVVNDGVRA